jgi:hypothetical protein
MFVVAALCGLLFAAPAWADQAACDRIDGANRVTPHNAESRTTGFAFDQYTPDIFGSGTRTCSYLRDEAVGGEPASVYAERYASKAGTTNAQIWISKKSGHLLREELDGEVPGKGKGHDSVRFTDPVK